MITTPEDYACHLAGLAAATFSMMFDTSTELRVATRALGAAQAATKED